MSYELEILTAFILGLATVPVVFLSLKVVSRFAWPTGNKDRFAHLHERLDRNEREVVSWLSRLESEVRNARR